MTKKQQEQQVFEDKKFHDPRETQKFCCLATCLMWLCDYMIMWLCDYVILWYFYTRPIRHSTIRLCKRVSSDPQTRSETVVVGFGKITAVSPFPHSSCLRGSLRAPAEAQTSPGLQRYSRVPEKPLKDILLFHSGTSRASKNQLKTAVRQYFSPFMRVYLSKLKKKPFRLKGPLGSFWLCGHRALKKFGIFLRLRSCFRLKSNYLLFQRSKFSSKDYRCFWGVTSTSEAIIPISLAIPESKVFPSFLGGQIGKLGTRAPRLNDTADDLTPKIVQIISDLMRSCKTLEIPYHNEYLR